jgi:hypothetical protein
MNPTDLKPLMPNLAKLLSLLASDKPGKVAVTPTQ